MSGRAIRTSIVLLGTMGLALGLSSAQQTQPSPAKAMVEVTYYYLPG